LNGFIKKEQFDCGRRAFVCNGRASVNGGGMFYVMDERASITDEHPCILSGHSSVADERPSAVDEPPKWWRDVRPVKPNDKFSFFIHPHGEKRHHYSFGILLLLLN
jgi:hypothetical protein